MWYFTPYYAILRAVPDQKLGALLMALSWWRSCSCRGSTARRTSRFVIAAGFEDLLGVFFITFLVLMWLGLKPADGIYVLLARVFTAMYFAFFILLPSSPRQTETARFRKE